MLASVYLKKYISCRANKATLACHECTNIYYYYWIHNRQNSLSEEKAKLLASDENKHSPEKCYDVL